MDILKNQILELLREDARFSSAQIAGMLNVDEAVVRTKIKEMENDGVILKYHAVTNRERLEGSCIEALVEIKVIPQRSRGYDNIANTLMHISEIKSLYLLSGGFDFLMIVEGKDIKDVAFFVNEKLSILDCVSSTATHFVLKKYKSEGVILTENDEPHREML
ncbi:MAG: Lrp/AsnC family transcriptional regulator [Clostridia bacterium]